MARFTSQLKWCRCPASSARKPKPTSPQHLKDMQNPHMLAQDNGVPRFMKGYLERQKVLYPVDRDDTKIAGVHAYVYTPKAGISAANRDRVLIDLHGGGFSGCWPACAELESIPIAALGKIRVISLDYREGPKYKFPAASEDVAAVYKASPERSRTAKHRHLRLLRGRHVDGDVGSLV